MSVPSLKIPKSYRDGRPLFEENVDEIRLATESWALLVSRAFAQLGVDIFGSGYQYNGLGTGIRATSLVDTFAAIAEDETITGAWTFSAITSFSNTLKILNGNDINLYSDNGTTSKFSVDGATGNTSVGGTLAVTGASTFTGTSTFNGSITPTGAVTGSNLKLHSGYDLIGYSDAGSTETCRIDTSTGEIKLLAVDPPQANYLNHLSGIKACGYWDDTGSASVLASYNIDSVTDSGNDGVTIITLDRDFSSVNYVVVASPVEVSDTRVATVSPVISSASEIYFYTYRITENTNSTSEILATDYNFYFMMAGVQ